MTNGFAVDHGKSLQRIYFCVKRQAKNDFLKDVESIVNRRMSGKQYRPWSDPAFCGVWSGSNLFA